MSPEAVSAVIAGAGVLLSLFSTSYVSGKNQGRNEIRLANLEANQGNMATKEQLAGVKEDLAEIKGMFRMTLRTDGPDGPHQ